jgi:hypothetical protein
MVRGSEHHRLAKLRDPCACATASENKLCSPSASSCNTRRRQNAWSGDGEALLTTASVRPGPTAFPPRMEQEAVSLVNLKLRNANCTPSTPKGPKPNGANSDPLFRPFQVQTKCQVRCFRSERSQRLGATVLGVEGA